MAPLNVATKSEIIEALVEARGDVTVRYVSAPNHTIPTILLPRSSVPNLSILAWPFLFNKWHLCGMSLFCLLALVAWIADDSMARAAIKFSCIPCSDFCFLAYSRTFLDRSTLRFFLLCLSYSELRFIPRNNSSRLTFVLQHSCIFFHFFDWRYRRCSSTKCVSSIVCKQSKLASMTMYLLFDY